MFPYLPLAVIQDQDITVNLTRQDIYQGLVKVVVTVLRYSTMHRVLLLTLTIDGAPDKTFSCLETNSALNIMDISGNVTFEANCSIAELFITVPPSVEISFTVSVQSTQRGFKMYGPFIIGMERKYSNNVVPC